MTLYSRFQADFLSLAVVCTFQLVPLNTSNAAEFYAIAGPESGAIASEVNAVSSNGAEVAGVVTIGSTTSGFQWSVSDGLQLISDSRSALGISGYGDVVVGYADNTSTGIAEPYSWSLSEGLDLLGAPTGSVPNFTTTAIDVSFDGTTIVGETLYDNEFESYIWTAANGFSPLDGSWGGEDNGVAVAVSDDGTVVAGTLYPSSGPDQAFRWSLEDGIVPLNNPLGGNGTSSVYGLSSDGTVIVGQADTPTGPYAFRWSEESGMISLVNLSATTAEAINPSVSTAIDASQSGQVIVGTSSAAYPYPVPGGGHAFVWTEKNGMESLPLVLENRFGLGAELAGWRLTEARSISADGRSLAGVGFNPDGDIQGWLVRLDQAIFIPEPSSLMIILLFLLTSCGGLRRVR